MGADEESGDSRPAVTIHIRSSNGTKFSVQSALDVTVGAFKEVVAGNCNVAAEQQRLIYKGRILKDDQTLASYGVESDHTIHLVRGAALSTASTNASTRTRSPNNPSGVATGSNDGGGLGGVGFGGSFFPGLGFNGLSGSGASDLLQIGMPELDQVQQQQQLTQDPSVMRDIMNMPVIQNLMNNPDLMRNLIMGNPQMRAIVDRNPELAHILNDPSTLRQTLEAARNPELMREMMRNTDRAMSNIESTPEGFNMLRRMYETVQEPFLNAATMPGDSGSDSVATPFAALLQNQGDAQSRDQPVNQGPNNSTDLGSGPPVPNANPLPNPWSNTAGGTQHTNVRPTPATNTRTAGITGLGGLGLPDLARTSAMQDPSFLNQFMQDPAVTQMMQNLLSDPQYMNEMLSLTPQTRSLLESNPQLREMLQNPEFLRQMMSPVTMQQLLSFQQSLFSQSGRQQPSPVQNQTGGTGAPNGVGLDMLMNMFGGLGAGGLSVPSNPDVPPEQLYAAQLAQLQEMGFFDTQENIRALHATAGNVNAAIERLLRYVER